MPVMSRELSARFDPDLIELDEAMHAMRYRVVDPSTTRVVSSGCWIWHIDAEKSSYCKMRVPASKITQWGQSLTVDGPISCPGCGISGTVVKGHWHQSLS